MDGRIGPPLHPSPSPLVPFACGGINKNGRNGRRRQGTLAPGRDLRIAAWGMGEGIKIMLLAKVWKSVAKLEASKRVPSLMSQTDVDQSGGGNKAELRPFRVAVKFKE